MYQAIVLLPLLGAILAGMIALAGARKRFPGAEPDDDHHAAPHGHAVTVAGDHSVIHETHHEPTDHGPVEAAAEGSRSAEIITTGLLFIAMALSCIALWQIGFGHLSASACSPG
jgi:NADH-quinone oxidoreductase subunit L